MALGNGVAALVTVLLATCISSVSAGIIGQLYCSTCGAGPYDALVDVYLPNVQVSVTCNVTNPTNILFKSVTFSGTATTDSNGVFVAPFASSTLPHIGISLDAAFSTYLFVGGLLSSGLLPGAGIVGCQVSASGTPCNVISYNNGVCAGGSVTAGNGNSGTNVALATAAGGLTNIVLGGAGQASANVAPAICLTYPTKPASCSTPPPAGSPPPPGVKGDPHFSGADGSHFDFTGHPNTTFCLITDAHLHVNAFYSGRYTSDSNTASKALTWIRKVGILWGHHTIQLAAREGARWQYDNGYMASMEVDGQELVLSRPGDTVDIAMTSNDNRIVEDKNNQVSITWVAAKEKSGDDLVDVYQVQVANVMTMRIILRPEIAFLRTDTDGLVHMSLEWPSLDVSESVHGVLGQTYRSDFKGRLGMQKLEYSDLLQTEVVPGDNAEGFLDGNVDNYVSSSLLRPDCSEARFARAIKLDFDTAKAREMAMGSVKSSIKVSRKIWLQK